MSSTCIWAGNNLEGLINLSWPPEANTGLWLLGNQYTVDLQHICYILHTESAFALSCVIRGVSIGFSICELLGVNSAVLRI